MGASRVSRLLQRAGAVRRGMAGARAWPACAAGSGHRASLRRGAQVRAPGRAHHGWGVLALLGALLVLSDAQAQIVSSRIWPARDYTRLTLESKSPVKHSIFSVKDPERLVLEVETDELAPARTELQGKVAPEDPYIKGLRVARNRPGVIRVVLDLKTDVKPQLFNLPPVAEYGHRLVLDIYPAVPVDPLAALIEKPRRPQAEKPASKMARLATVVIDAGHGGE